MPIEVTSDGFLPPDPDDLATFLGIADIDTARATMLLGLAVDLCTTVVSPLPDAARTVILSAAARAYETPIAVTQEGSGPFQTSYRSGGVYLMRPERAALRRLAGGGGAFSVDLAGISGADDATDYPDVRFPEWQQ